MDLNSFKHSFPHLVDILQRPLYFTDPLNRCVYEKSNWKIMDVTCSVGHILAVRVLLTLRSAISCHPELPRPQILCTCEFVGHSVWWTLILLLLNTIATEVFYNNVGARKLMGVQFRS